MRAEEVKLLEGHCRWRWFVWRGSWRWSVCWCGRRWKLWCGRTCSVGLFLRGFDWAGAWGHFSDVCPLTWKSPFSLALWVKPTILGRTCLLRGGCHMLSPGALCWSNIKFGAVLEEDAGRRQKKVNGLASSVRINHGRKSRPGTGCKWCRRIISNSIESSRT